MQNPISQERIEEIMEQGFRDGFDMAHIIENAYTAEVMNSPAQLSLISVALDHANEDHEFLQKLLAAYREQTGNE